jgi:hypothetical protein
LLPEAHIVRINVDTDVALYTRTQRAADCATPAAILKDGPTPERVGTFDPGDKTELSLAVAHLPRVSLQRKLRTLRIELSSTPCHS